uniref:Uncharacterized protein n=1 Tax=Rhizophora mucronata TaxID=61149 RepID=A0A2P2R1J6_RHIMU
MEHTRLQCYSLATRGT